MASDETGRGSLGRLLPALLVCLGVVVTLHLAEFRLPSREPASSPFPKAESGAIPRTSDPWHDRKWLRVHMDQACAAVEWVCGTHFRSRPRLYVQALDDLVAIYQEEDALRQERCGEEGQPVEQSSLKLRVEYHLGCYLQGLHGVCVSRLAVENSVDHGARRSLLSAGGLRLILVHEVVHALDHERHPDLFGRCVPDPNDDARWAVVEGHAQHVTAIVAEHWGLDQEFADLRAQYGDGMRRPVPPVVAQSR